MSITCLKHLNVFLWIRVFLTRHLSRYLSLHSTKFIAHSCVFAGLSLAGTAANSITGYTSGVASVVDVVVT